MAEANYEYLNARLRARIAALLSAAQLERFAAFSELDDLVRALGATPYHADLTTALSELPPLEAVEAGLARHTERTLLSVARWARGEPRALLAVLLGESDLASVNLVLRTVHGSTTAPRERRLPADLVVVGRLPRSRLQALLGHATVADVVADLTRERDPLAAPLAAALPDYQRDRMLAPLELAMQRAFYRAALQSLGDGTPDRALAASSLRWQVDLQDLMVVIRGVADRVPADGIIGALIGLGSLPQPTLHEMARAQDVLEVLELIEETPYAEAVERGVVQYAASEDIGVLERLLEAMVARQMRRLTLVADPLGIGLALSYLHRKRHEQVNLRIAARGAARGLPAAATQSRMILG